LRLTGSRQQALPPAGRDDSCIGIHQWAIRVSPYWRRTIHRLQLLSDRIYSLKLLSTVRRKSGTRRRFVFLTFGVMWLSLMLQPCTIAATAVSSSQKAVSVRIDSKLADADQNDGNDECRSTSVADECCCATSGIHDGSDASKRSLLPKNDDQPLDLVANVAELASACQRADAPMLSGHAGCVETLPSGPSITLRNCVYLI